MPVRLTRPGVGRIDTTEFQAPGRRIEAKPSSPTAMVEKLTFNAAPDPPDEPPTVRSRSYALRVTPKSEPKVSPPANSLRVVLPRMMAPALRSLATTKESTGGV